MFSLGFSVQSLLFWLLFWGVSYDVTTGALFLLPLRALDALLPLRKRVGAAHVFPLCLCGSGRVPTENQLSCPATGAKGRAAACWLWPCVPALPASLSTLLASSSVTPLFGLDCPGHCPPPRLAAALGMIRSLKWFRFKVHQYTPCAVVRGTLSLALHVVLHNSASIYIYIGVLAPWWSHMFMWLKNCFSCINICLKLLSKTFMNSKWLAVQFFQ